MEVHAQGDAVAEIAKLLTHNFEILEGLRPLFEALAYRR